MATQKKLEQRLAVLEQEVASLKKQLANGAKNNWLRDITGSFQGDPDFEEILKLGRDIRRKMQPRGKSS